MPTLISFDLGCFVCVELILDMIDKTPGWAGDEIETVGARAFREFQQIGATHRSRDGKLENRSKSIRVA